MIVMAEEMTFLEKMGVGGSTAILGMSIVFVVLFVLIGILVLMDRLFKKLGKDRSEVVKSVKSVATATENGSNDEEVVAVIASAIACIYASENGCDVNTAKASFVVKSIRKI